MLLSKIKIQDICARDLWLFWKYYKIILFNGDTSILIISLITKILITNSLQFIT